MKKRTGIMAHSRYLQVPNWQKMMWGEPPDLMGQFPVAILTALQEDAEVLVLGCGLCSGPNHEMESEFNWQYILDHFESLAKFPEFGSIHLGKAENKIKRMVVLDRESLSTAQEIGFSRRVFEEIGIERVIGITGPTHAPRCLNEALKFYGRPESKIALRDVSVRVSDVGWAPQKDVIIFEPPHRKDDFMGGLRRKAARTILYPEKLLKIKKALGL